MRNSPEKFPLPPLYLMAGQTVTFNWVLYDKDKEPVDALEFSGNFSVVSDTDRLADPILSKSITFALDDDSGDYNIATVDLDPEETVSWYGRYLYQLTFINGDGEVEIPGQGTIDVVRNINQSVIIG